MTAIHSLLSSRIEVDFVDQWVDHHLSFGVDKIYVYNSGPRIFYDTKNTWVNDGLTSKIIQELRPHYLADFRNDAEIEELFHSKLAKNNRVELVNLQVSHLPLTRKFYNDIQYKLNFSEIEKYAKNGVEWLFNIDGDEFLNGDLKSLTRLKENTSRVMLKQICYGERWSDDGRPKLIENIGELSPNLISICCKNVVKPCDVAGWDNVHYGVQLKNNKKEEWSNSIFFKHYRGHGYKEVAKQTIA